MPRGNYCRSLYAVLAGGERADWATLDPFSPNVGTKVVIPYFFYVVMHACGTVLVDTGAHPSLAHDPRSRLGAEADHWEILMSDDDSVVNKLAILGISPADVTDVVVSHLHYDHAGGLALLPNARVHVQRAELEFAQRPAVYQRGLYVAADFDGTRHWHTIDGDYDLFDDGAVRIVSTPGHTPGHQSALVKLEAGAVLLAADAAYLPENMTERHLPAVVWSPDAMVASWRRIEELAAETSARVLFTHDLGYARKVRLAPEPYQ